MVTLCKASYLSEQKKTNKLMVSKPECLVERVVTEFITGVDLAIDECGFLWDLEVLLEQQFGHQELIPLDCFHEWRLLRPRVTHEW
jgi:hypothetical protein